jgi:hypothetical protein
MANHAISAKKTKKESIKNRETWKKRKYKWSLKLSVATITALNRSCSGSASSVGSQMQENNA